jgi:glycosyltransferase involved in cell wall biosynthesis
MGYAVEHLRGWLAIVSEVFPLDARRLGLRCVVVVRPAPDAQQLRMMRELRAGGVRLVGDLDDLLFEERAAPASGGALTERARRCRDGLDVFDAFTVATEPLAERLRAMRPGVPVSVVPTGLSERWLQQGQLLYPAWSTGDARVIRYLPGSPSHDADFAQISGPLRWFLAAHDEVTLEIVGHLAWDSEGFPAERVLHRKPVPFRELPRYLASSWLNLAPLADSDFGRCKSAIKFLEAGAFGCPTIATPTADMLRHRNAGLVLAETPQAWLEALERLRDDDARDAAGRAAHRHVRAHGMARPTLEILLAALPGWTPA